MDILLLVGKILFGGYFALMGLNHFMYKKHLVDWGKTKGLPMPDMSVMVSGLALLAGGLSIIFSYEMMIGGWILIGFLFLAAVMMHSFWKLEGDKKMEEMIKFQMNFALIGAILMIMFG